MARAAGSVSVEPVQGKAALRSFVRYPWRVYGRDSAWAPPLLADVEELLDPKRHPFYQHAEAQLFLAKRDGEVVGRIAAIVNRAHLEVHHDDVGFFGFFESIDDADVAEALFEAAAQWLRDRGMRMMRGPASPSVNHEAGLLLDNFGQRPSLMMAYNPPYYAKLFETSGLVMVRELRSFMARLKDIEIPGGDDPRAERIVQRNGITVRNAKMKRVFEEAEIIRSIYNSAWSHLWGYVPMSAEEGRHMASQLKMIADERVILIAEIAGEPAGISLSLPDYNVVLAKLNGRLYTPWGIAKALYHRGKIRRLRLMVFGILKEYRHKGIELALMRELYRRAVAAGYEEVELSWILDDNEPTLRFMEHYKLPLHSRYGVYERELIAALPSS